LESSQISDITSVYRLLLFSPPEYFTKTSRNDLVRRALKADSRLSHFSSSSDELLSNFEALSIIRVFLKRITLHIGSIEQSVKKPIPITFASLIVTAASRLGQSHPALVGSRRIKYSFSRVSVDSYTRLDRSISLVRLLRPYERPTFHLSFRRDIFRSCCKTLPDLLTKIFVSYAHYKVFENPASIRARSFIRMIDILVSEFEPARFGHSCAPFGFVLICQRFSDDIRTTIRKLHFHQAKYLLQSITSNLIDDVTSRRMISEAGILMAGWRALLALGHWLELEGL
jgi:hypothetical protein